MRSRLILIIIAAATLGPGLVSWGGTPTGPVELSEGAEEFILCNGIVSAVFNKSKAQMVSLRKGERELMGGGGMGYFQMVANGAYSSPQNATARIVVATDECADVAFTRDEPDYPFRAELHYVLRRDESGFHTYVIFEYDPERAEKAQMEQMNWCMRLDPEIFRYGHVDDQRQLELPRPGDIRNGTTLSPREATRLPDGQIDDKYALSAMQGDHLLHGLTGDGIGVWVVQPSREDINGGPTNQELMLHQTRTSPVLLRMAQAAHYGSGVLDFDANDGVWRKVYGPWLLYVNGGTSREALWADAKRKAAMEADAWPYAWLKHDLYPTARGTVTGRLTVRDGRPAAGARIVLAAPEQGRTPNWQRQGKGFQFWAKTDQHGAFGIPNVRAGEYAMYAFVPGVLGEYRLDGITVEAGRTSDIGTLLWKAERPGKTLWQIGTADRSAAEYNGADRFRQWGTWREFPQRFPNGVDFRIGESKEDRDWYYQHCTVEGSNGRWQPVPWTVRFSVDEPLAGWAVLTVAIASSRTAGLRVYLNGREVAYWPSLITCGANCRDGIRGYYREKIATFAAWLIRRGENVLILQPMGTGQFSGIMYDCIRLEAASRQRVKAPAPPNAGDPVLAIYTTAGGPGPPITRELVEAMTKARKEGKEWTFPTPEPSVIVAAWGDGRIVWSKDRKTGGRAYFSGRIDAGRIDALVNLLKDKGIINDRNRDLSYYGPDAATTVIRIWHAKGHLRLESWHEIYEGPHTVANDHGLVYVDIEDIFADFEGTEAANTTRAEAEAQRSPQYLAFLRNWAVLRQELLALIPKDGASTVDVRFSYDDFR